MIEAAPQAMAVRTPILLVDDEAEILVALEDLLEDSYRIHASTSPAAALDLLRAHPDIAVIVSDQRMPEMPGNVFLARAREHSEAEAILLTGYADLSAVVSAVNEGAISGYVQKPWEPEALRAMVGAAAERHRLRAALEFEQSAFAALAERSADAVSVLDRAGRPVRMNARKRAQIDADLDPALAAEQAAADEQALASGAYSEDERRIVDPSGEPRWIRTRRIPFGEAGEGRHLLKIESDETERRLAEQKLHQAEKLQALGTLAGGIAHDFNNLLSVVIGNLELAARRKDEAKLDRYLASATEAAMRGSAISRRLLTFSRQRDLAAETFRPDEVIAETRELVVQSMAGRATVRLELDEEIWPIHTDPGQFELAIVNLCINARDAMPDGGEVTIAARNAAPGEVPAELVEGDFVRITVSDTGTGMSEELRTKVFEPFFTTKPHGRGTGLGLPMVRTMAEAAGGCVTIDSALGEGTQVHLWLPRAAPHPTEDRRRQVSATVDALRILVAEDDIEVAQMLSEHLTQAGHDIVPVRGGREALDLLDRDSTFDLLITDFAMPRLSGLELARRVAARWPDLPVLLVTGFAEIDEQVDLVVLTKPFTGDQLREAVAHALGANASSSLTEA